MVICFHKIAEFISNYIVTAKYSQPITKGLINQSKLEVETCTIGDKRGTHVTSFKRGKTCDRWQARERCNQWQARENM